VQLVIISFRPIKNAIRSDNTWNRSVLMGITFWRQGRHLNIRTSLSRYNTNDKIPFIGKYHVVWGFSKSPSHINCLTTWHHPENAWTDMNPVKIDLSSESMVCGIDSHFANMYSRKFPQKKPFCNWGFLPISYKCRVKHLHLQKLLIYSITCLCGD